MKRILMIADDSNRWGPARLPESLSLAGAEVAVLCSADNPMSHSSFAIRKYGMNKLQSWRKFGKVLGTVMRDWKPDLILPCDELVVVMLHYLLKNPRIARRFLDAHQLDTLRASIGKTEMLDAMVLKYETRLLAESLGVTVPKSRLSNSPIEAAKAAEAVGFPVYLKASFSWAGHGVIRCDTPEQAQAGFIKLRGKSAWIRTIAKRVLGRNWYPMDSAIEVQQAVDGHPVMYNMVALKGKVLGGLFARKKGCAVETAPSSTVEISDHIECRRMAEKMVSAMGASGFLAFDFMCCEKTGQMFMLECNPRPNQIFHLGQKVGADLCQALVDGLNGIPQPCRYPRGEAVVPLFPQAWMHSEKTALAQLRDLDIPRNDPSLLGFMLRRGEVQGHASQHLLHVLKEQMLVPATYPFG
jgi:hypothetical protein